MDRQAAKKPTFFWQGVLILLPLVALAGFGLYSLRQDRILAETDARERCKAVAETLAGALGRELYPALRDVSGALARFEVDGQGRLASIEGSTNRAIYPEAPIFNPLSLSDLSLSQAQLWQSARHAEFATANNEAAIADYRKFLDSKPPRQFIGPAKYAQALLLAKDSPPAADEILSSLEKESDALTETGLPLDLLAQLQRTRAMQKTLGEIDLKARMESLCSNAVHHPSLLTPAILDFATKWAGEKNSRLAGPDWARVWQKDEAVRGFCQEARDELTSDKLQPRVFWKSRREHPWLMVLAPRENRGATNRAPRATDGFPVLAVPETAVREAVGTILSKSRISIPPYAAPIVTLGGRPVAGILRNDAASFVAAHVATTWDVSGTPLPGLSVELQVCDAAALYAAQRQRTLWFGGLILISAMAAVIGLVTAWRGFHQQLRLNEMKSNFVSSVSHELRAPIASVRLLAEALDRGKITQPEKQKEYFRFIVQECRRLSTFIGNVLDFSRIEQGRKRYEFEPTDLIALAEQTVKLMAPYAEERKVALTFSPPSSSFNSQPTCDGLAIQQALINLVDNALKHSAPGSTVSVGLTQISKPGGNRSVDSLTFHNADKCGIEDGNRALTEQCPPTVEGEAHHSGAPQTVLHLYVEDQGPGIPPEEHEKIFERFYRRGSELRRETQGVGIGLSIVKHIVEAHGGRVLVRSALGQGSRFTIELPLLSESQTSRNAEDK